MFTAMRALHELESVDGELPDFIDWDMMRQYVRVQAGYDLPDVWLDHILEEAWCDHVLFEGDDF